MGKLEVVKNIINDVGGKNNINNVWHCMTRLRFDLKNQDLINYEAINKIPGVLGSKFQSGQLQIVIGTDVDSYYKVMVKELGIDDSSASIENEKKGIISIFMDTVSGVFGPIVPAIAGAGMIKGLMAGLVALNVISNQTDTYLVIDMLASGVFTFLPFFVAISAAKIFRTNQYLAVAIAAAMQFPTMTNALAEGNITKFMLFNFIPVPVFNYAGTVIPIIFAVLALSYIYRWVDKILPEVLRTVFTPTISLFLSGIIALTIIGPISIFLGNLLASGVEGLFSISPILAGVVVGAIRPIAIFTGLHHAMTPIALQNFANQGYDMLMPMMFMANMAITGATAAIYFKVRTKEEKSVVISSTVSGILGITEPALFGILSKYKKAFIGATIGSAVASAFISFFGVRIYGYILSSIFSLPAYIGEYFIFAVLGVIIALTVSFAIAYLLVPKEKEDVEVNYTNSLKLYSVVDGKYQSLSNTTDEVFSNKVMGDGYAIIPNNGNIYSPVSGVIKSIFPTKHAIGIVTNNGIEILVHMGINTVELNGKGFEIKVKENQVITENTQIASMDLDYIQSQGNNTTVFTIITNMDNLLDYHNELDNDSTTKVGDLIGIGELK